MNWQPISTAPRDETEFLAYDATTGKMDVCIMEKFLGEWTPRQVQSDGEYGPGYGEFGGDTIDPDGEAVHSKVTHWMPLPTPPTVAEGE